MVYFQIITIIFEEVGKIYSDLEISDIPELSEFKRSVE